MIRLWQNVLITRIVVLFIFTTFFSFKVAAAPDGKGLFKANCASCHNASEVRSTGPGLKDVLGRIPGGDWKYSWIRNSLKLIASGDGYAVAKFAEYNKSIMTSFPQLDNEQIDAILEYANKGDAPKLAVATTNVDTAAPEDGNDTLFLFIILFVFLFIIIAVLRYTKINLRNAANEKEGLPEQPGLPFLAAVRHWMAHHKTKVLVLGLLLLSVLTVKGWYALKGIGVYAEEVHPNEWVGYHPSQPINFSHKIHAGENAIQCKYCHNGVEKSMVAGIPAVNICMNCHKVIQQNQAGTEESKSEIAKIYFAAGWDSENRV